MKPAGWLSELPPAVQRTLALATLMLAATILWYGVAAPARHAYKSQQSWRRNVERALSTDRGWIRGAKAIGRQRENVQESPVWKKFYTSTRSEELSTQVRRDINGVVAASGASVEHTEVLPIHTEVLPIESSDGLTRAAVRIGVALTIDQLKTLLGSLRAHTPYLRVEQIHVSAPQLQAKASNPSLSASLDIVAYGGQLDASIRRHP